MILKRTGKDVEPGSFSQGVLTATDRKLFPAVHATAISLKEQRISYAVVDHGLTLDQVNILEDLDVMVLIDKSPALHSNAGLSKVYESIPAMAWRKPIICSMSPFANTAWIDADAIPLGYSHELFQWQKGFITTDHFVDDAWAYTEYYPLLSQLGGEYIARVNSGVFAFPLDIGWLAKWRASCLAILLDKRLAELAHCRDQAALVAAISLMNPGDRPVILTQPHWNYPADGCRNERMHERMQDYPKTGQALLDFARARHAGVSIVHWMGPNKPWALS